MSSKRVTTILKWWSFLGPLLLTVLSTTLLLNYCPSSTDHSKISGSPSCTYSNYFEFWISEFWVFWILNFSNVEFFLIYVICVFWIMNSSNFEFFKLLEFVRIWNFLFKNFEYLNFEFLEFRIFLISRIAWEIVIDRIFRISNFQIAWMAW